MTQPNKPRKIEIPDTFMGVPIDGNLETLEKRLEEEERLERERLEREKTKRNLEIFPENLQKAIKIKESIEQRIGFDGELVKEGVGYSGLWTYPNASYGLLVISEKFKEILEGS